MNDVHDRTAIQMLIIDSESILESVGLVNNEAEDLTLLNVVKTNYTDEAVGVLRTTLLYFSKYFLGAASVEQR